MAKEPKTNPIEQLFDVAATLPDDVREYALRFMQKNHQLGKDECLQKWEQDQLDRAEAEKQRQARLDHVLSETAALAGISKDEVIARITGVSGSGDSAPAAASSTK